MKASTERKMLYVAACMAVLGITIVSAPIYATVTWQFLYGLMMVMAPLAAVIGVVILATLLEKRIISEQKKETDGEEIASIG